MSLLDPASCIYAKTIVYELFSNDNGLKKDSAESMKQFVGRVNVVRFETMSSLFNNHGIPFKTFTDKFPAIIKSFQWIGKKSPEKRDKSKKIFSIQKRKNLEFKKKSKYTKYNCPRCQDVNFEDFKLFPVNSIQQKAKLKKMLDKYNLDNATTKKVAELEKQYKSKYNTAFTKVIKKKLFPTNKGKNKRKLALKIKRDIEYQMEESSVER